MIISYFKLIFIHKKRKRFLTLSFFNYFMYLQNFIQKVLRLHSLQSLSRLSFEPLRISLRPISICQLNALPHLHLRPINLVVFKGSYFFKEWDI